MSIKRTIITTATIVVAVAMVASVAGAQTTSVASLQAMIAQLQAQLNALSGTSTGTGTGACAGVTFNRNLTVGATGSDVKCLQVILNQSTTTRLAATGAGSPGNETTYFGPKTLVAVKKYQSQQGFTPANQVGPLTRARLNSAVASMGGGNQGGNQGGNNPPVTPTGAGLSVQLAYDNPAGGAVVGGQSQAKLMKLTFTNGDNAPVRVTTLRLTRGGVSSDALLDAVYLFNGAIRLTDAASVSAGVIGFNDSTGLFTVPAYGSTTVTVEADIDSSSSYVGQIVSINLASASNVTTNASSVTGNFPVMGNVMAVVSGGTLATAYFSTNYATNSVYDVNPSGSSIDPQTDYPVWYTNLNVNISNGQVKMSRLSLDEVGSINYSDIQNFRLYVDGVQVGSAVQSLDANGYVTFDLTNGPVSMQSGARAVKVLADIVGGSSRTFSFQLKTSADVTLTDGQYGVNIIPTNSNGTSNSVSFSALRSCYTLSALTYGCTINSGATTTSKTTDSPSGNVINGASGQTLARFTLKSNGERIKVDTIKVYAAFIDNADGTNHDCTATGACTTPTLRSAALYANGVQIGNTTSLSTNSASPSTFSLGSSLIVDPSTPVTLEVKADIYDNTGYNDVDATDTILVYLVKGSGNGLGSVSSSSVNVPTSTTQGNTLTVSAGGLTLSKYTAYTNQTVVPPVSNFKLGHFTLTAGTTESINLTQIGVSTTRLATYTTNLYVKLGNYTTSAKTTLASDVAAGSGQGANTWSVNYTIPAGQTVDVTVWGDVNSNKTSTGLVSMAVSGTTASSSTAVCAGSTSVCSTYVTTGGQTTTFGSGSATAYIDGSTPVSEVVAGGQEVTAGQFKVSASNDTYTITETKFTIGTAADSAAIQSAILKDGSNVLGTVSYDSINSWFYFTGLNVQVPANTTKVLTLDYVLATPYTDKSSSGSTHTTGLNLATTMSYIKALNGQGVVKDSSDGITLSAVGNYLYAYKTIPTFTEIPVTGQGIGLQSGSSISLYKFSVHADAKGPVSLKQLKFAVTVTDSAGTNSTPILDTFKIYREGNATALTVHIYDGTSVSTQDLTGTGHTIAEGGSTYAIVVFDTEETIPAGATYTYTLKARASGFGGSTDPDSVTTVLSNDSTPLGVSAGADAADYYLDATANTTLTTLYTAAGHNTGPASTYTTNTPSVIWSDNSAQSHSYTYSASSSDWFNGYLILNLPLDAQGINYAN